MAGAENQTFALRQLLEELGAQLRSGVEKLGELPHETGEALARELGLATREELDCARAAARPARAPAQAARERLAGERSQQRFSGGDPTRIERVVIVAGIAVQDDQTGRPQQREMVVRRRPGEPDLVCELGEGGR